MINFNPFSNKTISYVKEVVQKFISNQNKKIQLVFFTVIDFLNPIRLIRRIWNNPKDLNNINDPNLKKIQVVVEQNEILKSPKKEDLDRSKVNHQIDKQGSIEPDGREGEGNFTLQQDIETEGAAGILESEEQELEKEEKDGQLSQEKNSPQSPMPIPKVKGQSGAEIVEPQIADVPKALDVVTKNPKVAYPEPQIENVKAAKKESQSLEEPKKQEIFSVPEKFSKKCTNYFEILEYLKKSPKFETPECKKHIRNFLTETAKYFTTYQITIYSHYGLDSQLEDALRKVYMNSNVIGNFNLYQEIRERIADALYDYASGKPIGT